MASLPWMKDADLNGQAYLETPQEPVNEFDVRRSVKSLIEEYREKIDKIVEAIKDDPLYEPEKHDDVFLLRYCMSHKKKKTKVAVAAVKHTLQFRKDHDLDSKDIREVSPHKFTEGKVGEYFQKRCNGDALVCTMPDKQLGIVMFLKFANFNPDAAKIISEEVWDYAFIYTSEYCYQLMDYVTRTTGRMTKSIRLIDMKGVSMLKHMSRSSAKRDGKIMNEMEDCYPQLLETIFICNPPSFFHVIWEFFRPIMPARIIEKIDLVTPKTNEKERKRFLPYISEENLPEVYGGKNPITPAEW